MADVSKAAMDAVLKKIQNEDELTGGDMPAATALIRALGTALAVMDEANQDLQIHLAIETDANDAAAAARNGVLAGLQVMAAPGATVDIEAAIKAIDKMRKDIDKGQTITTIVTSAAKFAVNVAGKFI